MQKKPGPAGESSAAQWLQQLVRPRDEWEGEKTDVNERNEVLVMSREEQFNNRSVSFD